MQHWSLLDLNPLTAKKIERNEQKYNGVQIVPHLRQPRIRTASHKPLGSYIERGLKEQPNRAVREISAFFVLKEQFSFCKKQRETYLIGRCKYIFFKTPLYQYSPLFCDIVLQHEALSVSQNTCGLKCKKTLIIILV